MLKRNATTKLIRRYHERYVHDIIGDLGAVTVNDQCAGIKRFWRYVKASKRECVGVPTLHTANEQLSSDNDKARVLNDQFENAFTSENLDNVPELGESPFSSCPDIVFTTPGIVKLLQKLQPHKATGPDQLPPRVLKDLAEEIAPSVTLIFQQIYDSGMTPQDWRDAVVAPIYKKGNKHDPQNYRPVSLTSVLCKIHEHIICSSIMSHLDSKGILSKDQHGFRKGFSTNTTVVRCARLGRSHEQEGSDGCLVLRFL